MIEVRDGKGRLIGRSKGFSSKPLAMDPATVHVLPPTAPIEYIEFKMTGEFTIEAPRRDPCPYHYTGDPELPCRCPKAPPPSPYDVVIDGVDG